MHSTARTTFQVDARTVHILCYYFVLITCIWYVRSGCGLGLGQRSKNFLPSPYVMLHQSSFIGSGVGMTRWCVSSRSIIMVFDDTKYHQ